MEQHHLIMSHCCTSEKLTVGKVSQRNLPSVTEVLQFLELAEVVFAGWDFYDDIEYADAFSNEHPLNVSNPDQDLD